MLQHIGKSQVCSFFKCWRCGSETSLLFRYVAQTIKTIRTSWKAAQLSLSPSLLLRQNIYGLKEGPGTLALKDTLFLGSFPSLLRFWNSAAYVCGVGKKENVNKMEFATALFCSKRRTSASEAIKKGFS